MIYYGICHILTCHAVSADSSLILSIHVGLFLFPRCVLLQRGPNKCDFIPGGILACCWIATDGINVNYYKYDNNKGKDLVGHYQGYERFRAPFNQVNLHEPFSLYKLVLTLICTSH
jgi:hypothetical protein